MRAGECGDTLCGRRHDADAHLMGRATGTVMSMPVSDWGARASTGQLAQLARDGRHAERDDEHEREQPA